MHLAQHSAGHSNALWREFGGLKLTEIVCTHAARGPGLDSHSITTARSGVLILNLEGTGTMAHEAALLRLRPGDLLYVPAGLSLRWLDHRPGRRILVGLPAAPLPAAPCPIDGNDGIAAVLRELICTVLRGVNPFHAGEHTVIRDIVVQLVAAACAARRLRPTGQTGMEDTSGRQWRILRQSVEALLSDPSLSPAMVAASHGISNRHLHRLFRQRGVSFATYVRMRRLQRCRDDLADPHLGTLRLTEIAYRWGFSDSSHFSRCFKAAFGCTAREFRAARLSPSP